MKSRVPITTAMLGLALICVAGPVAAASLQSLDFFPEAVSGDGSVVVGAGLRWTESGSATLGSLDGSGSTYANGVSGDGSVVVGGSHSTLGYEAFRWTAGGGMIGLGDLAGGAFDSSASAASQDGSIIVGNGVSATADPAAFRWTSTEGMTYLGDLAGGSTESRANGISSDGSVIVGWSGSTPGAQAFRWTQSGGMVGLGDLAGGWFGSFAYDTSTNGAVVVGYSASDLSLEAFRWTEDGGMIGLGYLPGDTAESSARAVSGDGSKVVGYSYGNSGPRAIFWDSENGMQSVVDLLVNVYGLDLSGWTLTTADDISDDGTVIVGTGTYNGEQCGWIANLAVIPEAGSWALYVGTMALVPLMRRLRCRER